MVAHSKPSPHGAHAMVTFGWSCGCDDAGAVEGGTDDEGDDSTVVGTDPAAERFFGWSPQPAATRQRPRAMVAVRRNMTAPRYGTVPAWRHRPGRVLWPAEDAERPQRATKR